jgi:3D (Asp-Asp-Asp) domain-containing protein
MRLATLALLLIVCVPSVNAANRRPKPRDVKMMTMSATAYCQKGTTASGDHTVRGIVAADPRVLPLGSVVRIRALRVAPNAVYVVRDTGSAIKGRELDIFIPSCHEAVQFGRQRVRVEVLSD